MKYEDRKKLEEIANKLINEEPIKNKEYVKLSYNKSENSKKYKQKRSNFFISERRYL